MGHASAEQALAGHERTETLSAHGRTMCVIIRTGPAVDATTFYTPNDFSLQVGNVVQPAGSEIPRHRHRPNSRNIADTSEVLVVQKGRMILDVYDGDLAFLCSREMGPGDVVVLVAGGHGFHFLEDTIMLEVKQGPYGGDQDRERF